MKSAIQLSQEILLASKSNQPTKELAYQIEKFPLAQLIEELKTDNDKKTFWINIYNAFSLILLRGNSTVLLSPLARKKHFMAKKINICSNSYSLDNLEHGFIRNNKIWWSKGYFGNPFVSEINKKLSVNTVDPRIHFALNCGGKSCPPIKYYTKEKLEEQLNLATIAFLEAESCYDEKLNTLITTPLFDWYKGDFGGDKGILNFLKQFNIIPNKANPVIIATNYSWKPIV